MNEDYPFTSLEYAKMLGISKECLRGRRRAGKLEGEYITKGNQYYFKRVQQPLSLIDSFSAQDFTTWFLGSLIL